MLKDIDIKYVLATVKKPQANAPVERVHQVILNDHKDPWRETLAYIAWEIRASYHRTIMATPGQAVFGRDMIFNLASVVDWRVITVTKQRQVDTDNFR